MALNLCEECNNIMYFRREDQIVSQYCRVCNRSFETKEVVLLTKGKPKNTVTNIKKDYFGADATLPRVPYTWRKCNESQTVSYMKNIGERALDNFYLCTKCFYEWRD